MASLVVIGSGAMGLSVAYHAVKAGHSVEVLEAGPEPGGMAAHFDFDGLSIERFYHFICKNDAPLFSLLDELGIAGQMRWRQTSMGYFTGGRLHPWGDPISLLKFSEISFISRMRYALFAFICTRRNRWDSIERESARDWITRWCGEEVYARMWKPLFDLKFYQFAENISAAWIWTRIRRIGRSRKSLFQEELGYLEGGSETLVTALVDAIKARGGTIQLSRAAQKIEIRDGRVGGVHTSSGFVPADQVICTVPTPLLRQMAPDLPEQWLSKYDQIKNIGVCCLLFKLKKSVTKHFWVNISEESIEIPGIIEFSNLRRLDDTIIYVPYYMPVDHQKFSWPDERLLQEAFSYLQRINPELTESDIISRHVGRLKHAQPVCDPGFAAKIPPIETPIAGLRIADTCFYYPEDRGISESVQIGKQMADAIGPLRDRHA